jgi:hypothetical protein
MYDRWFDWLLRDADGHVVIWQAPNLPLWGWMVCSILELPLRGRARAVSGLAGTAVLGYWAVAEVRTGRSRARQLAGIAGLGLVAYRVVRWVAD